MYKQGITCTHITDIYSPMVHMDLGSIKTYCSDLLAVHEHTGCFISGTAVVGRGKDGE